MDSSYFRHHGCFYWAFYSLYMSNDLGSVHIKVLHTLYGYLVSYLASFNPLNVADKWFANLYYEFRVDENSSSINSRIYTPSYRELLFHLFIPVEGNPPPPPTHTPTHTHTPTSIHTAQPITTRNSKSSLMIYCDGGCDR